MRQEALTGEAVCIKSLQMCGIGALTSQTPAFEFFLKCSAKKIGTIPSKELYKFFDKEGNTLVLPPDITPSIARAAATLFPDNAYADPALRDAGETFGELYPQSYQGRLRENTQMGAELIGVESIEADAEMLALVVDCLTTIGLREFQISVGNVDYFQSLIEDAGLGEESEARVRELIGNRNFPGVEEYLDSIEVRRSSREALVALEDLYGGEEVLDQAENIAPTRKPSWQSAD